MSYDGQLQGQQAPIETASATTGPDNRGSVAFVLAIVAAAVVSVSLVFSSLTSCTAFVLDTALAEFGEEYPFATDDELREDWYEFLDMEDRDDLGYEGYEGYDELEELDEELYRLLGGEDGHEAHA